VEVFFSPNGGAKDKIISEINQAKQEVKVLAYLLTDKEIAEALAKAHERGVDVQVILDKKMKVDKGSKALPLAESGVPVYIDSEHSTAHNKIIIIDQNKVLSGSYNYVPKAETKNTENLIVLVSEPLNKQYKAEFAKHLPHAVKVEKAEK
ncbi:MAG: phospholipase D family protein, partial [Burkholderiales bacterium]|nr:phospholipase D family protein [Burkholderiales bacterium]